MEFSIIIVAIVVLTIIFFTGVMVWFDIGYDRGFDCGQDLVKLRKNLRQRKDVR